MMCIPTTQHSQPGGGKKKYQQWTSFILFVKEFAAASEAIYVA